MFNCQMCHHTYPDWFATALVGGGVLGESQTVMCAGCTEGQRQPDPGETQAHYDKRMVFHHGGWHRKTSLRGWLGQQWWRVKRRASDAFHGPGYRLTTKLVELILGRQEAEDLCLRCRCGRPARYVWRLTQWSAFCDGCLPREAFKRGTLWPTSDILSLLAKYADANGHNEEKKNN